MYMSMMSVCIIYVYNHRDVTERNLKEFEIMSCLGMAGTLGRKE